jgi:hypothetical protein
MNDFDFLRGAWDGSNRRIIEPPSGRSDDLQTLPFRACEGRAIRAHCLFVTDLSPVRGAEA